LKMEEGADKKKKIVLVIGATGRQGGGVLAGLMHPAYEEFVVRAFVRDPYSEKAKKLEGQYGNGGRLELVQGDFQDRTSLEEAMKGAYGVFSNLDYWTLGLSKEIELGCLIADVAKEMGVQHFIYSSLEDIEGQTDGRRKVDHFVGKVHIAKHVESLGLPYTFVKYAFYYESFLTPYGAPKVQGDEVIFKMPLGDKKFALVPVFDAGHVVARIFAQRDRYLGKSVGLAGDFLTGPEIAQAYERATHMKARFEDVPLQQLPESPPDNRHMWAYKQETADTVWAEYISQTKELHPDVLSLESWFRQTPL
jgi:uncharacterized protein YbjT (DUF2867 family)